MLVPEPGKVIKIESYKHNGTLHRVWDSSFVLKGSESVVILANDKTTVTESDGRSWVTREPAICYFDATTWFNIIGMVRYDGIYYYCNMSSPFVYDGGALKYIDYDLDVRIAPDMTYEVVDEDEYALHSEVMKYPAAIDRVLQKQLHQLKQLIHQRQGPFSPEFVDHWYERYLTYL